MVCQIGLAGGEVRGVGGRTWGWVGGGGSGGPEGPGGEGEAAADPLASSSSESGRGVKGVQASLHRSVVPPLGHSGVGPIRPRPRLVFESSSSFQGMPCERPPVPRPRCLKGDHTAAWEGPRAWGVPSVFFLCKALRPGWNPQDSRDPWCPLAGAPTCQHRARPSQDHRAESASVFPRKDAEREMAKLS